MKSENPVCRLLFMAMLLLLGLSVCGCSKPQYTKSGNMSGYSMLTYQVEGTVTDESCVPIAGIKVFVSDSHTKMGKIDAIAYTDEEGRFVSPVVSTYFITDQTITFEDIDEEENGGLFRSVTVKVVDLKKSDSDFSMSASYQFWINMVLEKADK